MSAAMRLGIITDEIDADLERALQVAKELEVESVELNSLWGRPITELSEEEIDRAQRLVEASGLSVCAIGTMAFKSVLLDEVEEPASSKEVGEHLDHVRRGCDLARRFDAEFVRVFSFRKTGMPGLGNPSPRLPGGGEIPDEMLDRIAAGLRLAGEIAEEAGRTIVIENVRSCWGNTCRNTALIARATDHPRVKLLWDPGNDFVSGGAAELAGYDDALPWMTHVHVKGASVADPETGLTQWERIGRGEIDYAALLGRLHEEGYVGQVVLETHWRGDGLTREESTRQSFADLRTIVDGIQSGEGRE